jgi:uncharacterized membrane protein
VEAALQIVTRWPGVTTLQNLHPLFVHFPIALLTGATAVYLAAAVLRRDQWGWAALWMLELGAVAAGASIWTGLRAGSSVMVAPSVRENVLAYHERFMIAAGVLSLLAAVWAIFARPLPRRGRLGFLALLVVMTAVLARGADYGGWMVYGYNAGGSLPQPIEFSQ